MMRRMFSCLSALSCLLSPLMGRQLAGRVVDEQRQPVSAASVYLKSNPVVGTITSADGVFCLNTDVRQDLVMVSFLGYELRQLPVQGFTEGDTLLIVLREQPVQLEETVVQTKMSRRKRRLAMEQILRNVRQRMDLDMPDDTVRYRVVSDARVNVQGQSLAYEQMIGRVIEMAGKGKEGRDSVQFYGELSKRYVSKGIEEQARVNLSHTASSRQRSFGLQVDSGTVVHRMLWGGSMKQIFRQLAKSPKRWTVSRENDSQTVLTYTESRNIIGMVRGTMKINYIIDSGNYRLLRVSSSADVSVDLLFSIRLKADYLEWLNLFNLNQDEMSKFKFKHAKMTISRNVIFDTRGERTSVSEKNMVADMSITDNKKHRIPIHIDATVKVTGVQTRGVRPYSRQQLRRKIPRQRVER